MVVGLTVCIHNYAYVATITNHKFNKTRVNQNEIKQVDFVFLKRLQINYFKKTLFKSSITKSRKFRNARHICLLPVESQLCNIVHLGQYANLPRVNQFFLKFSFILRSSFRTIYHFTYKKRLTFVKSVKGGGLLAFFSIFFSKKIKTSFKI